MASLPRYHFANLKFFDEAQIAKTGMLMLMVTVSDEGKYSLWASREKKHLVEKLKKSEKTEHYTIIGITLPDHEYPFMFRIMEGTSNAKKFVDFAKEFAEVVYPGDMVIGDNLNYHFQGWSGELVQELMRNLNAKYYRLPAYSPEFSPIELVWAFLKNKLEKVSQDADLLTEVGKILAELNTETVMGMYNKCGYY